MLASLPESGCGYQVRHIRMADDFFVVMTVRPEKFRHVLGRAARIAWRIGGFAAHKVLNERENGIPVSFNEFHQLLLHWRPVILAASFDSLLGCAPASISQDGGTGNVARIVG